MNLQLVVSVRLGQENNLEDRIMKEEDKEKEKNL